MLKNKIIILNSKNVGDFFSKIRTWEPGPVLGNLDLNRSLVWNPYSGTWTRTREPGPVLVYVLILFFLYSFMYSNWEVGPILMGHMVIVTTDCKNNLLIVFFACCSWEASLSLWSWVFNELSLFESIKNFQLLWCSCSIKFLEERRILHECGPIILFLLLLKWIKRVLDHKVHRICK